MKFKVGDKVKIWPEEIVGEVTKHQCLNDGGDIDPVFVDYYTVSGYTDGILAEHNLTLVTEEAEGE